MFEYTELFCIDSAEDVNFCRYDDMCKYISYANKSYFYRLFKLPSGYTPGHARSRDQKSQEIFIKNQMMHNGLFSYTIFVVSKNNTFFCISI